MSFEQCVTCRRPVIPNAAASIRQSGQICTCGGSTSTTPQKGVALAESAKQAPDLEGMFRSVLAEHAPDVPAPIEQQELIPGRRFTTDFAWPVERVCVEIEGACHRTKERFFSDCEKQNMLVAEGWTVLRFNGRMLRSQVLQVVQWLRVALERGRHV